mgnify:CR=1 FL=1
MKYGSQFTYFLANRRTQTNIRKLAVFLGILILVYIIYSLGFHWVKAYEGESYSWFSGFYWTLVTMTTLGYGDIVFHTDLGRFYSVIVLLTGVLFLLVMLPFTFIEFFYAPWMKALSQARAPRELPVKTRGHVIITHYDPVTAALVEKLRGYRIDYVILEPDLSRALELSDLGYKVVKGDPDDPETYGKVQVRKAALVVASGSDTINTNVTFTVREYSTVVPIVAIASSTNSIDILELAGATHVIHLGDMLGRSLARRVLGGNARVHVIGHIDNLVIGEATPQETPLLGRTIRESGLREKIGINVVGIWERGEFKQPLPETVINQETVLVLAGSVDQLRNYDSLLSIYNVSDEPVVIIGAGRVGRAAAKALGERQIDYRIIDKNPDRIREPDTYILGNAADRSVLEEAGIQTAHTVLVTTHDDDVNIYLTIYCRQLNPDLQIISRSNFERNIRTLHRAGADFVMSYATMGANSIFNIMERQDVVMIAEGLSVFNSKVPAALEGKSLQETDIRLKTGCSVIAISRDGELEINPDPQRVLHAGEELILIGTSEGELAFNDLYRTG